MATRKRNKRCDACGERRQVTVLPATGYALCPECLAEMYSETAGQEARAEADAVIGLPRTVGECATCLRPIAEGELCTCSECGADLCGECVCLECEREYQDNRRRRRERQAGQAGLAGGQE